MSKTADSVRTLHQGEPTWSDPEMASVPHSLYHVEAGKDFVVPSGHNLLVRDRLKVDGRIRLRGRITGFGTTPSAATPSAAGSKDERFVLAAADVAARGVTLSASPADPSKVVLMPFGGIEQRANTDFVVQGKALSWAGLSLELLLEVGDVIAVRYAPA